MFMPAVRNFCDTPAFFAAYMGAGRRFNGFCRFLRLRQGGGILRHALDRVTLRAVFMDAARHKGIAGLVMFMSAGTSLAAPV